LNEGHAAFVALERVGRLVREMGLTYDEAHEIVRTNTLFTTHTPVPAGHDRFSEDLMRRYFSDAPAAFGVPWERFYGMGLAEDDRESFNMTYLALSFASFANGVSKLHGQVSRELLRPFWPRLLEGEVPVHSVTNGVHLPTWTDAGIARLLGRHEGHVDADDFARGASSVDPRALWSARHESKKRMVERIRGSLETTFVDRGDSPTLLGRMLEGLDPNALWIGFARRVAPYKRAMLLSAIPSASPGSSRIPRGPCGSFSAARRTRTTATDWTCCARSRTSPAPSRSWAACFSSRTTASILPGPSCKVQTSG
jgi:alpha-glucan phosphorylase-like protein